MPSPKGIKYLKRGEEKPTMLVRPHPAHARDHYGEPCAAVPYPMYLQAPNAAMTYVGARIDFARSRAEKRQVFVFDAPAEPPVRVPVDEYFAKKLEHGELLPACDVSKRFANTDAARLAAKEAAA